MKTTIDRLAHKYALNIKQIRGPGTTKIADFKNLNKNFYDDIENNNITIRENTKLLNKIKNNSLKEFIYTNREIPEFWKNKVNYQDEILNVISKDKNLLSYIGSNTIKTKKYSLEKFPKINSRYDISKSLKNITNENNESKRERNSAKENYEINNVNNRILSSSLKNKYNLKKNDKLTEKEINTLMDDYKAAYPIKDRLNELYITSNYYNFNNNKNETIYNDLNDLNANDENKLMSTKKTYNSIDSTNRLMAKRVYMHTNKKLINKKQKTFRQNIFNNLSPAIDNTFYSFNKEKLKKINISNKLLNINKDNKNSDISKLSEISNPIIKKNIESINYYGPYFSFCPSCRNKNMEYFNCMDPKQCLEVIHLIKRVRYSNDIINIRRTSSVSPIKKPHVQRETLESENRSNLKDDNTENEKADKFI